jgi:hypothetical protein
MRSRVQFPVLPWEFFLEGEDSYDDHGLGSFVEFRFKAPLCLMGVPTSEVSYPSATTGRGVHKVHKRHVVAFGGGVPLSVTNKFTLYLHKTWPKKHSQTVSNPQVMSHVSNSDVLVKT